MRLVEPTASQLASVAGLDVPGRIGPSADEVLTEVRAGRLRPEWSVIAVDGSGAVVGRAMWWGRDDSVPIALEVWDVVAHAPEREAVAAALLRAGHEALADRGVTTPLSHTLRLPHDWRTRAPVRDEVGLRTRVAAAAGLTRVNERLQFRWDAGGSRPSTRGSLAFSPADDDTFLRLFADAARGSLDVLTRRELETRSPAALARDELDYYLACPGERSWWRTATAPDGTVVGIAIPSATPTDRNVGYLAVLPRHRGQGYVDEILAFITRFHAEQGAPRVTATTDVVNTPMAAAFGRAGYRCTETRLDLEAP